MIAITRRRRRAGTILAQCDGIINIDNLKPLTIPPICVSVAAVFNDVSYVIGGERGSTAYVIGGERGKVDYQDLI